MGLLTISKKVYLPGGHHRQPRNTSSTVQVGPTETYIDTTLVDRTADPQIVFDQGGQQAAANFLFWSATDGSYGDTQTDPHLSHAVGASGLIVTAWYYPVGGGGTGVTAIIDDAFSASKGNFIDDDFVTVPSDPSLTSDANIVGVVPTAKAQTLKANASVPSTGEPFKKWMSFDAGTASAGTLDVPAKANGLAFAIYERDPGPSVSLPPGFNVAIYGRPTAGVLVDAGGLVWVNGHPHPVDPWGPLLALLANLSTATDGAKLAGGKFATQVNKLAAATAVEGIKTALPAIQRAAEAKAG